jgi:hypothetical protein
VYVLQRKKWHAKTSCRKNPNYVDTLDPIDPINYVWYRKALHLFKIEKE